jgi:hypothetical protein
MHRFVQPIRFLVGSLLNLVNLLGRFRRLTVGIDCLIETL